MQPPKKSSEIKDEVKSYLFKRLEYLRLKIVEKTSRLMADLLSGLLLLLLVAIASLALTITIAFYLSTLMGSYTLGFGIASLFFLAGSLFVFYTKERLENKICSSSIKRYFLRHCREEETSVNPKHDDNLLRSFNLRENSKVIPDLDNS